MSATDTLKTAETLREAGMPERQASAAARSVDDAITGAGLVTGDQLRAELATLETRLYRAMLVHTGVIVGVIAAAVALLLRLLPSA